MNIPEDQLKAIFERYLHDECTEEELQVLIAALGEDPASPRQQFVRSLLDQAWDGIEVPVGAYPLPPLSLPEEQEAPVVPLRPARAYRWWWAAASILLLAAGAYLWHTIPADHTIPLAGTTIVPGTQGAVLTLSDGSRVELDSMKTGIIAVQGGSQVVMKNGQLAYEADKGMASAAAAYNVLTTPPGRQFHIQLPDGSQVWLNAGSQIRYPAIFPKGERVVELEGEAYFEVAGATLPDGSRAPFLVRTAAGPDRPAQEVIVLGTHFNINSYANENAVRTTLLEGSVRVNGMLLKPGQQSILQSNSLSIHPSADTEEAVSWKNGYFKFNDERIESVMRKIERWYNVEAVYEGEISQEEFRGAISRSRDISEVLDLLEATKIIRFRIEGRKIIVSR